jgi:hypothetical protein
MSDPVTERPAPDLALQARGDDVRDGRSWSEAIVVAGVELSPSAAAELALRLARTGEFALSAHVGRAVDQVRDQIDLDTRDHPAILAAIGDEPPPNLARLRSALLDQSD